MWTDVGHPNIGISDKPSSIIGSGGRKRLTWDWYAEVDDERIIFSSGHNHHRPVIDTGPIKIR